MRGSLPASGRRIALAVVVLVALVGAVQLLDPFEPNLAEPAGEPPAGDDPAKVLRYAVAQLDATSYTLTVSVNDAGNLTRFSRTKVNYTERELSLVVGHGDLATRFYFHADGAWAKPPNHDWRHGGVFDPRNRFREAARFNPYRRGAIRPGLTRFHNESESALWIRVDGKRQNDVTDHGPPGDAYTLYELDPKTYRIRRSVEYSAANGTVRNVYVFEDYGRTTVSRPPGTRDLPVNLLSDLLR